MNPQLVIISWQDATEWSTREEMENEEPLSRAQSVGWLTVKKDHYELDRTRYDGHDRRNDGPILTIPKSWAVEIRSLSTGKKVKT